MATDKKKCQTMINIMGQQALIVRAAIDVMKQVRTAFTTIDPDTTGTPLDGKVALVNTALNDLDAAANENADGAVWDAMIAAIVPTHRNHALEEG